MPDKENKQPRQPRRPHAQSGGQHQGHVRIEMSMVLPVPEAGLETPPHDKGEGHWIGRIVHGDANDVDCTDSYHVYTDVYEEDKEKVRRMRSLAKYSSDPVVKARVDRLYDEVIIPAYIEQYVKETGETSMLVLLPPEQRRRYEEDKAGHESTDDPSNGE